MKLILNIKTACAMQNFGKKLALACDAGTIIFLQGDLGVGKTTLIRGFLRGLDYHAPVRSPTFTLLEPYVASGKQIFHFDLYRLADPEELEFIGIRDYFNDQAICLIEWPEKGKGRLADPDLLIEIDFATKGRTVIVLAKTSRGEAVMRELHPEKTNKVKS
jgi:tRNA threonylcarbamoyladenosine biosynthesis protein TsaE